jgi:hypothetical protein
MRIGLLIVILLLISSVGNISAQRKGRNNYITNDGKATYILSVAKEVSTMECITNTYWLIGVTEKIPWNELGTAFYINDFYYSGIDNQHNMHVIYEGNVYEGAGRRRFNMAMIFPLDANNAGDISFSAFPGIAESPIINLRISMLNGRLIVKSISDIPLYKE